MNKTPPRALSAAHVSSSPRAAPAPGRPVAAPTRATVRQGRLAGRTVTLCVTGSIAAYKAALIARLLVKEGADVFTVLSDAAHHFIGPMTFAGITGHPVHGGMFDPSVAGESHVALAARSDLVVVAPATADVIARLAQGRADDPIGATVLCAACPVLLVPAMHPNMWSHPATQRNVARLEQDGRVERLGPAHGEVASGDFGEGRMVEPEEVVSHVLHRLSHGDFDGRHVVVTAGPTAEDIDPVRFISNRSSGKMGFAVAERAAARGARVTLIAGPVNLPTPHGVHRIDVRSAIALRGAVWQALGPDLSNANVLVMAAAVADYRPAETHSSKLKKEAQALTLELTQNPDILAEVGNARRTRMPVLIGFALETDSDERITAYARSKLEQKGVDLVIANRASDALERDESRAAFITATHTEPLYSTTKVDLAERILDFTVQFFEAVD